MSFQYSDYGIDFKMPKEGVNANTFCPKCRDQHPDNYNRKCLSVHVVEKRWKCHRCDWSGGLAGGEKGSRRNGSTYTIPKVEASGLSTVHQDYLVKKRGLDLEMVKKMGLFSQGGAIGFPYFRDGKIVNVKYRTLNKKMWVTEGAEMIPYGLNLLSGKKPLFIFEGEIDLISFLTYLKKIGSSDEWDVLSVSNGANSGEKLVNAIKDNLPNKIYLATDMDEAGCKLADNLASQLGTQRCWRDRVPSKDLNQSLRDNGVVAIDKAINQSKAYHADGVFQIEDLADRIYDYYENGVIGGIKLGWPSLDEFYTVKTSYWTIVTGVPHSGKSGFVDEIVVKLIDKPHNWKFAICSPENQPPEIHFMQLLEKVLAKPFLQGKNERMSKDELDYGMEFLNGRVFMALPERDGQQNLSMDAVLGEFDRLRFQHGCLGYVIDPFNELLHIKPPDQSKTEYVGEWISLIRRFCRVNNVHTWVVAHPRKFDVRTDGHGHGQDTPVVRPSDIEESRHWWGKGDNILSIWRSQVEATDDVAVHIQKVKPRYIGRQGVGILKFDKVANKYWDPLEGK